MKIATWNCNMAFRKKAAFLLAEKPDIVIIPECENPERLNFDSGIQNPTDIFWYGENPNKGLGVFSYNNYKFSLLKNHNPSFKTILPLAVTGGKIDFTLFAIWANNASEKNSQYIEQVWKAIHYYDGLIKNKATILIGDFNSNSIWDKPRREGNHSAVIKKLEERKIYSVYHHFHKQVQGKEEHPTLYMYRHFDKPYHIDYCFASIDFIHKLENVEVGGYEQWSAYSDHKPVMVTFKL